MSPQQLEQALHLVRAAGERQADATAAVIEDRCRIVELLAVHAGAGVDETVFTRLVNLIANPSLGDGSSI